jgi:hypothetical protein
MKKNAVFLNLARGAIVDEQALYTALTENMIAGAALDVLVKEPMDPENPLLKIQDSRKLSSRRISPGLQKRPGSVPSMKLSKTLKASCAEKTETGYIEKEKLNPLR